MAIDKDKRIIAIWGYPNPEVYESVVKKYPGNQVVDLDIDYKFPNSDIVPSAYCRIIRNIIDNAVFLKDRIDVVVASVGEEKCNSAKLSSLLLRDMGFNVIETKFENYNETAETPICKSNLPLKTKITTVMDNLVAPQNAELKECKPKFGFWGVPPHDLNFLELFPDETHVYGWIRGVEARRPADFELEAFVDEGVPTVFFAQTFCHKNQLAKYLAKKHNGLYIDVDDIASRSVKAKIEAFIELG